MGHDAHGTVTEFANRGSGLAQCEVATRTMASSTLCGGVRRAALAPAVLVAVVLGGCDGGSGKKSSTSAVPASSRAATSDNPSPACHELRAALESFYKAAELAEKRQAREPASENRTDVEAAAAALERIPPIIRRTPGPPGGPASAPNETAKQIEKRVTEMRHSAPVDFNGKNEVEIDTSERPSARPYSQPPGRQLCPSTEEVRKTKEEERERSKP